MTLNFNYHSKTFVYVLSYCLILESDCLSFLLEDDNEKRLVGLERENEVAAIAFNLKAGGTTAHPIVASVSVFSHETKDRD